MSQETAVLLADSSLLENNNENNSDHNPASSAQALQEQRVLAVRDINHQMAALQGRIDSLTDHFGQAQNSVGAQLGGLQERAQSLLAEVMRLSLQLEQTRQEHAATQAALEQGLKSRLDSQAGALAAQGQELDQLQARQEQLQQLQGQLDSRLNSALKALNQELDAVGGSLGQQQVQLEALEQSHYALEALHQRLAETSLEQEQALATQAEDQRRQFQVQRTHIDGLSALYREQQQAFTALRQDHGLLSGKTRDLETELASLGQLVSLNEQGNRKGLRLLAGSLAALALLSLGLIGYFQLYPSAVPESVKTQLAQLSLGQSAQQVQGEVITGEVGQLQVQVELLSQQLGAQQQEIRQLRSNSQDMARTVQAVRREVGSIQQNVQSLRQELDTVKQGLTTPAAATTAP